MLNKTLVALGADIKNKLLLVSNNQFSFGPELGDLSYAKNYEVFKKEFYKIIKKTKINIIAYDLHPAYFSSRLVKEYLDFQSILKLGVQHHHAHIASAMHEHNLRHPVIGVSFDGTGYGSDGNVWGGEFLMVDGANFKRLAHFKYRMMPGAEKVVIEPWRMVLSILGTKAKKYLADIKTSDKDLILLMMAKGINSPLTSSVGRLFDAAAALLGICSYASCEAQGPIKLEKLCDNKVRESYKFKIIKGESLVIDVEPVFLGMLIDMQRGREKEYIAAKFHNSIVETVVKTIKILEAKTGLKDIVLSGGVFCNDFLKTKTIEKLKAIGFNVFINEKTPVGDYNISLGQYYVSCATCKN